MRVLLLSAYHSASHRYWCEGLIGAFPEIEWTLKTQKARHFSWRVRASGWIWGLAEDPDLGKAYDLIIATSLSNVVALRALHPNLALVPLWLYFHENQFEHPVSNQQQAVHQTSWQFQSLQNAFCADWISFNTRYNRDTFFEGARRLLKRLPEKLPEAPLERMRTNTCVLPVPLSPAYAAFQKVKKEDGLIVWNHRWEWDKQPQRFLDALLYLKEQGTPFKLAMLGSGGGRTGSLETYRARLDPHIVAWGEADKKAYLNWLRRAAVGVSSAIHDFQGLSVLELAQAGARVVLPRRLAYPENLPGADFYNGSFEDSEQDSAALARRLREALKAPAVHGQSLAVPTWKRWRPAYAHRLDTIAGHGAASFRGGLKQLNHKFKDA